MENLSLNDKILETPEDNVSKEEKLVNDILIELSEYIEVQIVMSNYKKNLSVNLSIIIEKFYMVENYFDSEIRKHNTLNLDQIKVLKSIYEEMLFQKFSENDKHYLNKIDKEINESFNSILSDYFGYEDLSFKFSNLENKETINEDIRKIYLEIKDTLNILFLSDLEMRFKTTPPTFLIKSYLKKMKRQIKISIEPYIKDHFKTLIENKFEFVILNRLLDSFIIKKINLFDYGKEIKSKFTETLFNIFVLSNVDYFKNDIFAYEIFTSNLKKYVKLFSLGEKDISQIENSLLDLPNEERSDFLKFNIEFIEKYINNYNEKYFWVILSYSLIFNNIVNAESEDVEFNGDLLCNNREQEFLINTLKSFKVYYNSKLNPFVINLYCQSFIINSILKSKSIEMFDDHMMMKEKLNLSKIEENLLKETVNEEVKEKFSKILKENKFNDDSYWNYFKQELKHIIHGSEESKLNLNLFSLSPLDNFYMSTRACICVSGFTSEMDDLHKSWENLTLDLCKVYDFYFLNWPSENKKSLAKNIAINVGKITYNIVRQDVISLLENTMNFVSKNNTFHNAKEKAKVCGKLLAYIIASNSIYKFQTLSLVGFSLGTHLIKSCLKELFLLSKDNQSLNYKIQNVILIAGATKFKNKEKWGTIFDRLVSGRIVNIYGNNDHVLKYIFKVVTSNDAIGQSPLDINSLKVENHDFTDMNLGHNDYRKKLNEIIKRIKLV